LQRIDFGMFELQPRSHINEVNKEAIIDVLYKTLLDGKDAYLYLLVEHQRKPDKLMPFKMLKYTCNIIDAHLKKMNSKKIPLVYPIVVHQGKRPWPYSTHIQDLVEAPRELVESYFLKPFHLIDLSQISDEKLKQQALSSLMEFVQKHIFANDVLPYIREIAGLLRQVAQSGGERFVIGILEYTMRCGEVEGIDSFIKVVNTHISTEIGGDTMSLAQRLIEQGERKGRLKGKVEMMHPIAINLLLEGQDVTFIAKVTGLSVSDISSLQEQVIH
jgi:predicted transposase/invertase (TIGR01784 family)